MLASFHSHSVLTLEKQHVLRSSFFIASKIQLNLPFLEYSLDSSVTLTLCLNKPQLRLTPLYVPWADRSNVGQKFWPALSLRIISPADESLLLPARTACPVAGNHRKTLPAFPAACSCLQTWASSIPRLQLFTSDHLSGLTSHLLGICYMSQGALTLTNGRFQNYCFFRLNRPWRVCVCITSNEMQMLWGGFVCLY